MEVISQRQQQSQSGLPVIVVRHQHELIGQIQANPRLYLETIDQTTAAICCATKGGTAFPTWTNCWVLLPRNK